MQPQTDAEMHAWNWGVARAALIDTPVLSGGLLASGYPPAPDSPAGRAYTTLGAALFRAWADRGYAAARAGAETQS